jgi:AraC family transcriptional activator of pobA
MDMASPAHYLDYSTVPESREALDNISSSPVIPHFYLYGEPQRAVAEGFVHVENLDDRSRPSEWTIRSHVHRDLNHIIFIAQGGGSMQAEEMVITFGAPCLLLIPAGVVHGFEWHRESKGQVTTIADSYLRHLVERDADLAPLLQHPRVVSLLQEDLAHVIAALEQMDRELAWAVPGQRAVVEANLLLIMAHALRRARMVTSLVSGPTGALALVARMRERVEQRFRMRESVAIHAKALGISATALRKACAHVAGTSPAAMLDERALLEARRLLLYSNLSVTQVAYFIGFDDPAYFSRFFTRHIGQPPRKYRAGKGKAPECRA